MKTVQVVFVGDGLSSKTRESFLRDGQFRTKRPRLITSEGDKNQLTISYGDDHQYSVVVDVDVAQSPKDAPRADWYVLVGKLSRGHFTTSPNRLAKLEHKLFMPGDKILLINEDSRWNQESYVSRVAVNAANHLAAEITSFNVFRPSFLAFPSGINSRHYQTVAQWIKNDQTIKLVSGCCLNADETRRGIVDNLENELTDLLARTCQAAFDQMPINDWYIYTFGPKDYEFLGDLGIQKVLLPYMWDAPKTKVVDDLVKNYDLIVSLGQTIQKRVKFPVKVGQLSDYTNKVDISWLVETSRERARVMLPKLMDHPPAIFNQLESKQDIFDRVQQEAFLYLLDTIRWGQTANPDQPKVLYAGLEVHGGYWAHGNLFDGPNGEFLPLSWFPQCVRQHWGKWVLKNRSLAAERMQLASMLNYFGY